MSSDKHRFYNFCLHQARDCSPDGKVTPSLLKCLILTFLFFFFHDRVLFPFKWLHLMMDRGGGGGGGSDGAHAWSLPPSHLLHRAGRSWSSPNTYSSLYLTLDGICNSPGVLSCKLTAPSLFQKTFLGFHSPPEIKQRTTV